MFLGKRKDISVVWLEQQNPPVPLEGQLKFTDPFGWLKEYDISLRKPNKRFVVSLDDKTKTVTKTYTDPKICRGDQITLHRNESSLQETVMSCHAQVKTLCERILPT